MSSLLKKTLSMTQSEMTLKKVPSNYNNMHEDIADTLEKAYYMRLNSLQHLSESIEEIWSQQSVEAAKLSSSIHSNTLTALIEQTNIEKSQIRSIANEDDLFLIDDSKVTWQPGRTFFCGKWCCDRCQTKTIQTERVLKGRDREGGDYGIIVYLCQQCGLMDWCSYHDLIEKEDDEYIHHNSSFLV